MRHSQRRPLLHVLLASLLLTALLLCGAVALAAPAGNVTHISGPLLARKADGSTRVLSVGSAVEQGDTLITQKRTYARVKFTDGGEVTLKPSTQFKVEQYTYDQAKPKNDAGSFNLIKGGLRAVTGQIGKRGNQDAYRMKAPTATIGIRGTIFTAIYVEPDEEQAAEGLPEPVLLAFSELAPVMSDALPFLVAAAGGSPASPGLFVYTWQGSVMVTNAAGSFPVPQNTGFQFSSVTAPPIPIPPTVLPTFTPPAYFPPPGTGAPPPPAPGGPGGQGAPPSGSPQGGSGSGAGGGGGGGCQVPGSM